MLKSWLGWCLGDRSTCGISHWQTCLCYPPSLSCQPPWNVDRKWKFWFYKYLLAGDKKLSCLDIVGAILQRGSITTLCLGRYWGGGGGGEGGGGLVATSPDWDTAKAFWPITANLGLSWVFPLLRGQIWPSGYNAWLLSVSWSLGRIPISVLALSLYKCAALLRAFYGHFATEMSIYSI